MGGGWETYIVVASRRFNRDVERLPERVRRRVLTAVRELAENPYLGKPLRGFPLRVGGIRQTPYSLRVGDYRVIYIIDHFAGTIFLITVGHRRNVYKKL